MPQVLVIGSGPAGISAALTLQNRGIHTTVATTHQSRWSAMPLPADLYGIPFSQGEPLYAHSVEQARNAGVTLLQLEITGLQKQGNRFFVAAKTPLTVDAVVLATGAPKERTVPEFAKNHPNVHLRAEDQPFYYRNRMVGVLGCGEYAMGQAALLARTARTVTVFTHGDDRTPFPSALSVNRYKIAALGGNGKLESITFENGAKLNLDGLFLADRVADAEDLCAGVGILCQNGLPKTLPDGSTDCQGLFATGECAGLPADLHELVYHGYKVGQALAKVLK